MAEVPGGAVHPSDNSAGFADEQDPAAAYQGCRAAPLIGKLRLNGAQTIGIFSVPRRALGPLRSTLCSRRTPICRAALGEVAPRR